MELQVELRAGIVSEDIFLFEMKTRVRVWYGGGGGR